MSWPFVCGSCSSSLEWYECPVCPHCGGETEELRYCPNCNQMKNHKVHRNGWLCLRCKAYTPGIKEQ